MESTPYMVIILRGWRESDSVRVRILVEDGTQRQWVIAGVSRTCALVAALLDELADGANDEARRTTEHTDR
jgi:hypothetical protein